MTATRHPSRLASSLAWLGSAGVLARRGSRVGHLPFASPAAPPAQAPAAGSKPAAADPLPAHSPAAAAVICVRCNRVMSSVERLETRADARSRLIAAGPWASDPQQHGTDGK